MFLSVKKNKKTASTTSTTSTTNSGLCSKRGSVLLMRPAFTCQRSATCNDQHSGDSEHVARSGNDEGERRAEDFMIANG